MKKIEKEMKEFQEKQKKIKKERNSWTPNDILIYKDHAKLILRNKDQEIYGIVLIDKSSIPLVRKYKWRNRTGYAMSQVKGKTICMHRLLMKFPKGIVDHKNRNRLDNRMENLRNTTTKENNKNRASADEREGTIIDMTR